jgi:AcrR family transcriptional regulator
MISDGTTTIVFTHYLYSPDVPTLKERALDAAVDLLGTQGLRALTHARVDDHAGLPKGSTSNYFRTRKALLSGVLSRLAQLDVSAVGTSLLPASREELVDALCGLLDHISRDRRVPTTARLVLFLEASHDEDLRASMTHDREAMESIVVVALARLGARDPVTAAAAVAACFEGLLLHRIARHDASDPRPVFQMVVGAALS